VLLNGKSVNIPSMRVKLGDVITLKTGSLQMPMVIETLARPALERPEWLQWDESTKSIKVTHLPDADQVPFPVDVQQVVEYYSNRI
jgi:small subunit ribosomal protein S4